MALAHRFNINSQSTNGTETGTNLSLNDIIPVQPVTKGTSADDEKVTLQQLQSIPYGLGALNGSTYNVTLVNYPADYTLRVGSKMIVKFASAKSGSTVLNLAINGQTIPMLMQGSSLTEIAANQIIEFTFIGTISGSAHTITGANASAGITTSQLNGALIDYATLGTVSPLQANNVTDVNDAVNLVGNKFYDKTFTAHYTATNLPTSFSGNWRIDFRVRYISGGYTQAVQIAYSMPVGSNDNQLITKMFIRSVYYKDNTYTFGSWQKYVTESDVNTTLANYTKVKIYENQTPSDTTNKFYTISDLDGKTVIKAEVFNQANKTAILYSFGEGKAPRIRFFDFSASAFNTSNALNNITKFKVYYHD